MSEFEENNGMGSIAIIGMTGRFPEAKNIGEFWENLRNGVESVKFFNRDQLIAAGIDEHLLYNPKFVAADAILDDMDLFDASFFDFSAREAEIMDPQHRLFLECAWEVLESAGYSSENYPGRIAVYAGSALSGYLIRNLYSNPGLVENVGTFKIMIANSQDFLATRVSYKLNLMGPSVNVNTLCSSSMVGVHLACQNLLSYNCDLALAGGVSFQISRNEAFFYQEGGIGSADGHCRAFDSRANGTTSGSGLGIVVLKRIEDALADGDHIYAVIRGTAVNNDGSSKNSFTAPNVDGQAECIAEAIAMSGVNPETISYIDAHGTGTDLGDPIEIAALTKAYRSYTQKKNFCGIGSVKTNIGHLVTAGGVASLIKTVLSMQHRLLPPSLNFENPNRKIDFINSPFYVHTKLTSWQSGGSPLRAGVSSFGIGGTNTHVIVEEAPPPEPSGPSRPWQLVVFSAKTGTALERMTANLAEYVRQHPDLNPADLAFTLQVGRRNFNHRRMLVCRDNDDLRNQLGQLDPDRVLTRFQKPKEQPVVMMFPGEDSLTPHPGLELYQTEPAFQETIDQCAELLQQLLGFDLPRLLYPEKSPAEPLDPRLNKDGVRRAATFVLDYALAKLWIGWEVKPQFMVGEGTGELVAACLAGVFSLPDALLLVSATEETLPEKLKKVALNRPEIPFISGVTGTWITDSEATDRQYWGDRQRRAARLTEGLREILKDPDQILLEVGPGQKLSAAVKQLQTQPTAPLVISTLPGLDQKLPELQFLLRTIGQFWLAGGRIDWNKFYAAEKRHRIPLPTYPFERERYWIKPGKREAVANQPEVQISKKEEITDSLAAVDYQEGTFSITINLDPADNAADRKKHLEKALQLKEGLEEFCKKFTSKIEFSPLGLKAKQIPGQTSTTGNLNLTRKPRPDFQTPYAAPRNEAETIIAERWQDVLGFDRIGIHDDFFELGGHSLLAAAVANELSKVFEVQIPFRTLFETTTVAGIADLIETYRWATQDHSSSEANGEEEEEEGTL
jgi:phthiocerol/phenolphthiocerol synthesis type-I polyketide synthase E